MAIVAGQRARTMPHKPNARNAVRWVGYPSARPFKKGHLQMGLFDDIIKSAVKEALEEMAKQNNETEQTPAEQAETETIQEETTAEVETENVSRETFDMDEVSKMIKKEIRSASAQMLNRTPAETFESKTPDEAMRDILGLGEKGKNNGNK